MECRYNYVKHDKVKDTQYMQHMFCGFFRVQNSLRVSLQLAIFKIFTIFPFSIGHNLIFCFLFLDPFVLLHSRASIVSRSSGIHHPFLFHRAFVREISFLRYHKGINALSQTILLVCLFVFVCFVFQKEKKCFIF